MPSHTTLILLLILCQVWWAWGSGPPRLNVSDEVVVTRQNGNFYFSLRCEGSEPLYWDWTSGLEEDYVTIEDTTHSDTDHRYVSTFTVNDPLVEDTGFYYCYYSSIGDGDLETDKQHTDSTYVYINDGVHTFTDSYIQPEFIRTTTSDKLIIPCRTTSPGITVTLIKDSQDITGDDVKVATYDHQVGFVLRNVIIQDSGEYKCHSGEGKSRSYIVEVKASMTQNLPKPHIDTEANQHFVVGEPFSLRCTLLWQNWVSFHWDHPNSPAFSPQNVDIVASTKGEYRISTLTVKNASLADSGRYECTVRAPDHVSNNAFFPVEIMETLNPYISITSERNDIPIMEGENLKWKSTVRAYPTDPILIYRNWTMEEVDDEPERVRIQHNASMAESWLYLDNVTAFDHGEYVLEGITSHGKQKDSVSCYIKVKSKPKPWLEGVPAYVTPGQELRVSCVARGFPLPEIAWKFQVCGTGPQNCSSDFQDLQSTTEPDISEPKPGNIRSATMSFVPQDSGLLQCLVNNDHGSAETDQPLPISDVGGLFVMQYTLEGKDMVVSESSRNLEVIVDDTFRLVCAAAKFNYSSVNLTFSGQKLEMVSGNTDWSWKDLVEGRVTESHEGTYTCSGTGRSVSEPTVKKLKVKVRPQEEVVFKHDANMLKDGHRVSVQAKETYFSLNCTVTGTPKPAITWFKNNEELKSTDAFFDNETTFLKDDGQRLVMKHAIHEGSYHCVAKNRVNELRGYLTLGIMKAGLSTGAKVGLGIAICGIIVLIGAVVCLVRRVKTERKFRKSFRRNELYLFEKGNVGQLNPDCTADEQAELLPYDQEWEVPKKDIRIGKQLGSGAFGRVVKATVTGLEEDFPTTTVAIKMCKSNADPSQVRALALELKIMIHLGKHLNIVNLMGASTVDIGKGELWILVEYCRFGNLQVFLQRHRRQFVNQIDPTTGRIDVTRTMQAGGPLSPGTHNSLGFKPAPITDQDGYLAPSTTNKKFPLASPPRGHSTTPTSPLIQDCTSSETEPGQVVDNPLYMNSNAGETSRKQAGEEDSESDVCPMSPVALQDPSSPLTSHPTSPVHHPSQSPTFIQPLLAPQPPPGYVLPRPHSCGSEASSQCAIVNTDMTTTTINPLSPPPFSPPPFSPPPSSSPPFSPSPLAQQDSYGLSMVDSHGQPMVDSRGMPYSEEVGNVPGVTAPFTTSELICWAWQVAQGMDYLSSRKVLHGDLAARNLLLADNNVVKISDFGLSRDMYKKDVYMKKADDLMPIKWMSVEAIRDRIFSVQSDVWAYGVTVWELFSLGSVPYPGTEVNKDFLRLLEEGHRMDRPKYANKEIYDLLLQCWEGEPMMRPTFKKAAEVLGSLMLPDLRGEYMTMNDPYLRMNEERFTSETDYLNMLSSPHFDNITQGDALVNDENDLQYVNVKSVKGEDDADAANKHYLRMSSPGASSPSPNSASTQPHYLPMQTSSPCPTSPASSESPSPMTDVFSPRPIEPSKFTFGQVSDTSNRLPDVPEEEVASTNHVTENSSLINGTSKDSSGPMASPHLSPPAVSTYQDPYSRRDSEDSVGVDVSPDNGAATYLNLKRIDSNYVNM